MLCTWKWGRKWYFNRFLENLNLIIIFLKPKTASSFTNILPTPTTSHSRTLPSPFRFYFLELTRWFMPSRPTSISTLSPINRRLIANFITSFYLFANLVSLARVRARCNTYKCLAGLAVLNFCCCCCCHSAVSQHHKNTHLQETSNQCVQ